MGYTLLIFLIPDFDYKCGILLQPLKKIPHPYYYNGRKQLLAIKDTTSNY